jgi:hypothetical protein
MDSLMHERLKRRAYSYLFLVFVSILVTHYILFIITEVLPGVHHRNYSGTLNIASYIVLAVSAAGFAYSMLRIGNDSLSDLKHQNRIRLALTAIALICGIIALLSAKNIAGPVGNIAPVVIGSSMLILLHFFPRSRQHSPIFVLLHH